VVPVALALSLPVGIPFREELQTMVFGVAVIGTVIQGLLTPTALRLTGLAAGTEE
jgi:CPA1 family monovalent cation:H+ antiporter